MTDSYSNICETENTNKEIGVVGEENRENKNQGTLTAEFKRIIYWENLIASGIILFASLSILISMVYISTISVLAYVGIASLLCSTAFKVYTEFIGTVSRTQNGGSNVDSTYGYGDTEARLKWWQREEVINVEEVVQRWCNHVSHCDGLYGVLHQIINAFLVRDIKQTFKMFIFLYIMTIVGAYFNFITIAILGVLGAFTIPITVELNKDTIKQFQSTAGQKLMDEYYKIKEIIMQRLAKKNE